VMMAAIIVHTFNYHRDYFIPERDVVRAEGERTRLLESIA
jgi:cytochrome o ubiquinol oxidase subunit 1